MSEEAIEQVSRPPLAPGKFDYEKELKDLLKDPENAKCADCGAKGPRWASYNIGCFLCIRCGGIHRKIGTHVSKVKSLTLDTWKEEHIKTMQQWGNVKVNEHYVSRPEVVDIPWENEAEMEQYVRDKYERHYLHGDLAKSKSKFLREAAITLEMKYPKEFQTFHDLGFINDRYCIRALIRNGNNIDKTIAWLKTQSAAKEDVPLRGNQPKYEWVPPEDDGQHLPEPVYPASYTRKSSQVIQDQQDQNKGNDFFSAVQAAGRNNSVSAGANHRPSAVFAEFPRQDAFANGQGRRPSEQSTDFFSNYQMQSTSSQGATAADDFFGVINQSRNASVSSGGSDKAKGQGVDTLGPLREARNGSIAYENVSDFFSMAAPSRQGSISVAPVSNGFANFDSLGPLSAIPQSRQGSIAGPLPTIPQSRQGSIVEQQPPSPNMQTSRRSSGQFEQKAGAPMIIETSLFGDFVDAQAVQPSPSVQRQSAFQNKEVPTINTGMLGDMQNVSMGSPKNKKDIMSLFVQTASPYQTAPPSPNVAVSQSQGFQAPQFQQQQQTAAFQQSPPHSPYSQHQSNMFSQQGAPQQNMFQQSPPQSPYGQQQQNMFQQSPPQSPYGQQQQNVFQQQEPHGQSQLPQNTYGQQQSGAFATQQSNFSIQSNGGFQGNSAFQQNQQQPRQTPAAFNAQFPAQAQQLQSQQQPYQNQQFQQQTQNFFV